MKGQDMNAKHTPGKWQLTEQDADDKRTCRLVFLAGSGAGKSFGNFQGWSGDGVTTREEDAANASRIVACVNACEGINPEAVPGLLKALQRLAKRFPTEPICGIDAEEWNAAQQARAAIAKAEGR